MANETVTDGEALRNELRELSISMRHSAGTYMVPGWDGWMVASLIERAIAAIENHASDARQVGWLTQAGHLVELEPHRESDARLYGWRPVFTLPDVVTSPPEITLAADANSLTDAHIDAIAESVGIDFEPRFGMSSVGNVQLRRFARAILAADAPKLARPLTREEEDAAWDSVTEQGCSCCTAAVRLFCQINGIALDVATQPLASDATPQEELKTLCDWVIERVDDTAYECSGSIWMHAIELREAANKLKEVIQREGGNG